MKYTTPSIYKTPSLKNTSSSHLPLPPPPPPPHPELTTMSSDRLMKWLYGYKKATSLTDTNNFDNHAPGIIYIITDK